MIPLAKLSYHMFLTQMVNTRKGGGIDLPDNLLELALSSKKANKGEQW
jgi:hypothetical protein